MSLDSMADILHCMEQEGKEFWEVVLARIWRSGR